MGVYFQVQACTEYSNTYLNPSLGISSLCISPFLWSIFFMFSSSDATSQLAGFLQLLAFDALLWKLILVYSCFLLVLHGALLGSIVGVIVTIRG